MSIWKREKAEGRQKSTGLLDGVFDGERRDRVNIELLMP
jgi:hypothetical protein